MRVLNNPVARVLGSAVSWLLFVFCFTLLYRTSAVVMALGGSCASGGPYVIEVECPESVLLFAPMSIFGIFIAAGIALVFARGFGTPLVLWGWTILFVGLGIAFLLASFAPGGVAFLVVAILFIAMGLVPLLIVLRVGAARLLVGTTNAHDRPFRDERGPTPIFRTGARSRDDDAQEATAGDWLRALGIPLPAILVGVWLGVAAFAAAAA
jgi:hypothetical protein